ncbi:hypothetical protein AMR41_18875 [Hapalosiphon sp. MRB220]|nr:hypothetical protein AMR41_18875 [Hapalosiphon sp. MRB220]
MRTWRFITLILTALSMGMAFCHTLELPAKMTYSGSLYVTIQNSLYRMFGPPGPGAFIEPGAVFALIVLSFLVRKRRPAFQLTLVATIFWLLVFPVVFFLFIEPVNAIFRSSTPESLPTNWMQLRNQWEYSHATRFILQLIGFSALLLSVLLETPKRFESDRSQIHETRLS